MDLGEIRKKIDALDTQILDLFIERMGLTTEVAKYKAENHMVVFQSDREKAIIQNVKANTPDELKKSAAFLFIYSFHSRSTISRRKKIFLKSKKKYKNKLE